MSTLDAGSGDLAPARRPSPTHSVVLAEPEVLRFVDVGSPLL
ncbi:hypothetical protein ABTW72_00810 [Micromonospora sp. NPDC127501]